jgi:hypothetical protein
MKELRPEFLAEISAIQLQMTDALGSVAHWQKQFESLRPLIQLPSLENVLPVYKVIMPDFAGAIADVIRPLDSMQPYLKQMTVGMAQSRALAGAGWLPHATLPMDVVNQNLDDPEGLSDSLEKYYRENWSLVRDKLVARVQSYLIDDEAKAAFRETLEAHGHSLYRLVCRSVFPEIERVARAELHDNDLSIRITSQKMLQELAGETPVDEVDPHGFLGLELFKKLTGHSYAQVENEQAREQMRMDAVPNRHAALHGIVTYSSFKNSLNAIFLADYVFQIINAFRRERLRTSECASGSSDAAEAGQ